MGNNKSTSMAGWLLTVAYRWCANKLRHERTLWRRVQAALFASTEVAAPDPEPQPDAEALGAKLQGALAALPPKQRAALVMRHLDGMAQTENAKTLGRIWPSNPWPHKANDNLRWQH